MVVKLQENLTETSSNSDNFGGMAVKRRITVAGYNQNWSGAKTKMEKHKGVARAMKKFPGQYTTLIETIIRSYCQFWCYHCFLGLHSFSLPPQLPYWKWICLLSWMGQYLLQLYTFLTCSCIDLSLRSLSSRNQLQRSAMTHNCIHSCYKWLMIALGWDDNFLGISRSLPRNIN